MLNNTINALLLNIIGIRMSIAGYVNYPTLDTPYSVQCEGQSKGSTEWLCGCDGLQ